MKIYARVRSGIYVEFIDSATYTGESGDWVEGDPSRIGQYIPIEERYPPSYVEMMHEITGFDPMPQLGWTFDGVTFSAPVEHVPTPEEIMDANLNTQAYLATKAVQAMAPVLISLQLGDATDQETLTAKAWQSYYRALQAVDVSLPNPKWPVSPSPV
ncbi:hypothetical protein J2X84_002362 [Pseudomonas corrugata]|uniref:tail fiber assembly protein n=1 Tax=Pseudomonas corrugata TaxID=47879 RepID=UPI0028636871|nr:tail fiber assembly protein [Pseudomonas corrugata]MDR7283538.1 hypothetical protein [Pseudomonas corrugata]